MKTMTRIVIILGATSAIGAYTPGTIYFGEQKYVQYRNGNLPIVISIPHGGSLSPSSIPNRTAAKCGSEDFYTVQDMNTIALAVEIRKAFYAVSGKYPHAIQLNLTRSKLDANRSIERGACGNVIAEQTWREYHGYITQAINEVKAIYGNGVYIDLHGHGHKIQRVEIGYNLTSSTLRESNEVLDNDHSYESASSISEISNTSPYTFTDILRGEYAFGTLLRNNGFRAVPSYQEPFPLETESYTYGGPNQGYSIGRHGGIMLEHNYMGIRDTSSNRAKYAKAFVAAMRTYLRENLYVEF